MKRNFMAIKASMNCLSVAFAFSVLVILWSPSSKNEKTRRVILHLKKKDYSYSAVLSEGVKDMRVPLTVYFGDLSDDMGLKWSW